MPAEPHRAPLLRRLGTVRSKLTLLATAVVAGVLTLSAFSLVGVQERLLTHGIDEALVQRADNIEPAVARGALDARLPNEGDPEDTFTQLVAPDGRVIASSVNISALPAIARPLTTKGEQVVRTVTDVPFSSRDFRVLARGVGPDASAGTLVVGKNLDDVDESVHILTSSLGIAIPVVTFLLALLLWWLTGGALKPVESIRAEVASIRGTELHRRVPEPQSRDEISRLARTMNAMLDRVEQATERQRRFVADASHELRGPLTRMRSNLEVAIAHPTATEPAELHPSLLDDTVDLQRLVDDLLFLARSDSGAFERPTTPVDLDDLVLEEARALRERGRVRVDTSGVSGARTLGDRHQLSRAITNLASNAERHAESQVSFELREYDGRCELVVADDGPGIPEEHHAAVFKRFTRLDEARSRDAGGAGLGLAIVHDIVTRHRGTVTVTDTDQGGARLVVRLPSAD